MLLTEFETRQYNTTIDPSTSNELHLTLRLLPRNNVFSYYYKIITVRGNVSSYYDVVGGHIVSGQQAQRKREFIPSGRINCCIVAS